MRASLYRRFFAPNFAARAGTFSLPPESTLSTALAIGLIKPLHTDATITILPGWNIYDIDPYLAELGIMKAGDLISAKPAEFPKLMSKYAFLTGKKSFEGFLFPDTYRIRQGAGLEEVLGVLFTQFDRQIYSKIGEKNDWYNTLVLASIVEREERDPTEKSKVAGVLARRIDIWMSLWADATICYALGLGSSTCTPTSIVSGLDSTSPYNTRKFRGLPPTPIASVSRDTWLATIAPVKTSALYYLHAPDGNIYYGDTLEEHNANKRKYLR